MATQRLIFKNEFIKQLKKHLTTDISAIENNQSIGTLCFGLKKGVCHALDEIIEDISKSHNGYTLSRHKLISCIN